MTSIEQIRANIAELKSRHKVLMEMAFGVPIDTKTGEVVEVVFPSGDQSFLSPDNNSLIDLTGDD